MLYFLSFTLILTAVFTFYLQSQQKAPYGRFHSKAQNDSIRKFVSQNIIRKYLSGVAIGEKLDSYWNQYMFKEMPSRLGWMIQESPNLLLSLFIFKVMHLDSETELTNINRLCLLMFAFHYVHRTIIYPLTVYGPKQPTTTWLIVSLAFLFSCFNGVLQGLSAATVQYYPFASFFGVLAWIRVLLGLTVFCTGFWINVLSDRQLHDLKNQSGAKKRVRSSLDEVYVNEKGKQYFIPIGGLFDFVTSANYLGEIVEWMGYFLVSMSWASFAFAVWNVCYLVKRGQHNHEWYQKHFKKYPSERFAVIPFLV